MVERLQEKQTVVWTVAGFDPSGGAGVTADLLTFAAHGLFGCCAITALTVQSTRGVRKTEPVQREQMVETLGCLLEDLPPAGVKIGMLGSPAMADVVGEFLRPLREGGATFPVVLDPVLQSSSGRRLYPPEGMESLHEVLLPQVDWVTPNWGELEVLTGVGVSSLGEAEEAARCLIARYPATGVIVTGGDAERPVDLLVRGETQAAVLEGERVETESTHGTGCAFSSAFLARLVMGYEPVEAARLAKVFVTGALRHAPGLGAGKGPLGLLWPLREGGF